MKTISAALTAAILLCACGPSASEPAPAPKQSDAPDNSLFTTAPDKQWRLPRRLAEISGLAFTPDGRLMGHDDERAVIYELDIGGGELIKNFALGEPIEIGDFEGLAITRAGDFYLITSTGVLYAFREAADGAHAPFTTIDTGLAEVCEIEGLAADEARGGLLIACKTMRERADRDNAAIYFWPLGEAHPEAERIISVPISTLSALGLHALHPSSIDIDVASGRIILIAAREAALLEIDAAGAVLAARRLAGHPQAEGAAISPDGDLIIADEAGPGSRAMLSRYLRRQ